MTWNKLYQSAQKVGAPLMFVVGIISSILLVVGWTQIFFEWGKSGPFVLIRDNIGSLWLIAISAFIMALLLWTWRLRQQIVGGYSDNFRDLDGWDYEGPWRLPEKGTLVVTGSDAGGITKIGSHWENYTFTFKAKIINKCLGVIVRAIDLNNYYMFQIRADKVRPHRRVTFPAIVSRELPDDSGEEPQGSTTIQHIEYKVIWQMDRNTPEFESVPITPNLQGEFDVKIIVRGRSVHLYINNETVFERPSLLQITTGKIGFRNNGNEEAHVKNVRVKLHN